MTHQACRERWADARAEGHGPTSLVLLGIAAPGHLPAFAVATHERAAAILAEVQSQGMGDVARKISEADLLRRFREYRDRNVVPVVTAIVPGPGKPATLGFAEGTPS